jgi:hypothetical protein
VLNITRYIEWPEPPEGRSDEFRVGLLGQSKLEPLLMANLEDGRVGSRPIVARSYPSMDLPGWQDCELLFVGESLAANLPEVLQAAGETTLTVSDLPDFVESGGAIGLTERGRRVKIEISRSLIEQGRLKVSSKLIRVATIVD